MAYNNHKKIDAAIAEIGSALERVHGPRFLRDQLDEDKGLYEATFELPYGLTHVKVELTKRAMQTLHHYADRDRFDKELLLRIMTFLKLRSELTP